MFSTSVDDGLLMEVVFTICPQDASANIISSTQALRTPAPVLELDPELELLFLPGKVEAEEEEEEEEVVEV